MRRRQFVSAFGGAAAWALVARAKESERVRRIGILLVAAADDSDYQSRVGAFLQALGQLGWTIGDNLRIDTRWAAGDAAEVRRHAADLVALAPDVILAHGSESVGPLLQVTRTVPIVFPISVDPVGAGFVDSLARPGRNATGFMVYEYSVGGKWLELLKEIASSVTRVGVVRDFAQGSGTSLFTAIQALAPSLRVEVNPVNVRHDAPEIERAITAFMRSANDGLIVVPSSAAIVHRSLIVSLAAQHNRPAVYFERLLATAGGLISYGPDYVHQYRLAAGYVEGAGTDQIRAGHQSQDRQGDGLRSARHVARPR
jgi:putative ABC transport system substrate-binding protein